MWQGDVFLDTPKQIRACSCGFAPHLESIKQTVCQAKHPWFEVAHQLETHCILADFPASHSRGEQHVRSDLGERDPADLCEDRLPPRGWRFSERSNVSPAIDDVQCASIERYQPTTFEPSPRHPSRRNRPNVLLEQRLQWSPAQPLPRLADGCIRGQRDRKSLFFPLEPPPPYF